MKKWIWFAISCVCLHFFPLEAAKNKLLIKRFQATSAVKNHEPVDYLPLSSLKNREFYLFLEIHNCSKPTTLVVEVLTTTQNIITRIIHVPVSPRFLTYQHFSVFTSVKEVKVRNNKELASIDHSNELANLKSYKNSPKSMVEMLKAMQDSEKETSAVCKRE